MSAASLDQLRWRSSLPAAADVPGLQDLLRAALICRAEGLEADAGMLGRMAEVSQGFSPQLVAYRSRDAMPPGDRGRGSTVEIAVAELAAFARAAAPGMARAIAGGSAPDRGDADPADDIAGLVGDVHGFLADPSPAADAGDALIARLDAVGRRAAMIDYRRFAEAPLPLVTAAMALAAAQDFAVANRSLLHAPVGGAAPAHHAARFDGAGLGPYFRNLRQIAGRSRDVFELAAIARRAGLEVDGDIAAAQWVVLLSQHLDGALRNEIVDDLGDVGAMAALAAMLDRAVAAPAHRIEIDLVMRLRDAALDNGDHALAARAQAVVVRLRPDNMLERRILGEIDATGGRIAAAEQSFLACLRMSPGDPATLARLEAVHARAFAPFAVAHGWGTPPGRLATRLRRRRIGRVDARVETRRALSVEL